MLILKYLKLLAANQKVFQGNLPALNLVLKPNLFALYILGNVSQLPSFPQLLINLPIHIANLHLDVTLNIVNSQQHLIFFILDNFQFILPLLQLLRLLFEKFLSLPDILYSDFEILGGISQLMLLFL